MGSADTEKSRILIHELEPGWWILVVRHLLPPTPQTWTHRSRPQNIALTRIARAPPPTPTAVPSTAAPPAPTYEYSSREVSPAPLLLAQLRHAHAIFLLHHAPSLAALYTHAGRARTAAALARFWSARAPRWDVMLHGAPAVDIFAGTKLTAGGELGVGVGEEEWGSGEREVLEGFIARTPGLVDVVASRFGEGPGEKGAEGEGAWLGAGRAPGVDDGVMFAGVGALRRTAVATLAGWMEWVARDGTAAYGVLQSPHSARRKRKKRRPGSERQASRSEETPGGAPSPHGLPDLPAGIPPPIVRAADRSLGEAEARAARDAHAKSTSPPPEARTADTDTFMRYMTLGLYNPARNPSDEASKDHAQTAERGGAPKPSDRRASGFKGSERVERSSSMRAAPTSDTTNGCFLIGLRGNLEDEEGTDDEETDDAEGATESGRSVKTGNRRILLRTLYLERTRDPQEKPDQEDAECEKPIILLPGS